MAALELLKYTRAEALIFAQSNPNGKNTAPMNAHHTHKVFYFEPGAGSTRNKRGGPALSFYLRPRPAPSWPPQYPSPYFIINLCYLVTEYLQRV